MQSSYCWVILWGTALFILSCQTDPPVRKYRGQGATMGTTYHITTVDKAIPTRAIDSLLEEINQSVSTYLPESLISKINQCDSTCPLPKGALSKILTENWAMATSVFELSEGYFDPTVMPLVNAWGFGYEKRPPSLPDSLEIDSLLDFVGWEKLSLSAVGDSFEVVKKNGDVQIDFSAVAKGYAVDVVSDFLTQRGMTNHMVEIGGEVRCEGRPDANRKWTIGITRPVEEGANQDFQSFVALNNAAMATSGNYRNYFEYEGKKVSHSINPHTGFPERNSLLSASITAPHCALADALATACMVMGIDKAKALVLRLKDIEAYFIFGDEKGNFTIWQSPGFPLKQ